ncbi:MAG: CoA-binding protein [Bacteroidales bacterium]|nr:CoA-binding protein [Bacteroidales bacterium]MCF8454423.1 CoA-binding protein [Bacteroidales bacterium]
MQSLHIITDFFENKELALVGVSATKRKFGNVLFKELKKKSFTVYPVHPTIKELEGQSCYSTIADLPDQLKAIVINTKPENTLKLLPEIKAKGIVNVWLQQGSENQACIDEAKKLGLNFTSKECLLMFLEPVGSIHKFHRGIKKLFGKYPK